MRKTSGRENGNLLATSDTVHGVNGRNTGLDHFFGVNSRVWIDGLTLNVEVLLGKDLGTLVDSLSGAVKNTTQHVLADRNLEGVPAKLHSSSLGINSRGALEDLVSRILERPSPQNNAMRTCTTALRPSVSRT